MTGDPTRFRARPDDEPRLAAVALSHGPTEASARVLAKGYGDMAQAILRKADDHGLPVHRSPELLALLIQLDLDREVPPAVYRAMAELLLWLQDLETDMTKHEG